jgi:hypothetical protein
VVASVVAGAAIDGAGNPSAASTSNDNSVAFTMNQAPTAANDTIYVSDGANVTVPVSWLLGNDVDPDGPAPIFDAIVSSSGGSSGVFSTTPVYNAGNGTITFSTDGFTNNNNTIRTGSITYRIEDSADPALTKTAVVTVNVVDFGITNGNDNYTIPNTLYQGAYLDGQGGNDAITGGSAADILLGGDGNDTLTGGGGADQIYGGSGSDTLVADQSDVVIDGGSGTDTLRVGADFASTGNGQIVGIENVVVTASGVNLSLSNQTEGFDITAHSGGGTITAGAGADTVNISAGTNATNWTINLGGDTAADKIVFSHASIGSDHNTLATVSNFNVAHDKIAVLLNGANIADGNFRTLSSTGSSNDDVSSGNEIIEITSFTAASLTADGGNAGVESAIASAIDNISAGNYTVIVYSGTGAGADAGIYTMNVTSSVSGSGDLGTAGFSIEHIMTLSGVGYGSLSASNFASTADPIVLDLGQNGITFSNIENGVQFDMDADGEKEQLAWTNGEDGLLVMDLDGSGAIENGTEVLSPHFKDGGYGNSLDALTSLDDNADGILDLSDAAFGDLRVWSDANRDGESQASELLGLSDLGVESIDLGAIVGDSQIDGQHVFAQGQFTMVSGETGDYVGVNFDAVSVGASQMAMAEIENPQPQAA